MKKILLVSLLGLALTGCGVKSSPPASVEEKPIDQAAINDAYCHSGRVLTKNQLDGLTKTTEVNLPLSSTELGAPLLMVDWNKYGPACWRSDHGWKIVISFANLAGPGWGRGFFEYSTYNFSIGTQQERYALPKDFVNISENKPVAHPIEVDGVKGFVEYYFGPCIANCEGAGANVMEKRIVFPFANHYSAVVYRFSGEYLKQDDKLIDNLYRGNYPESDKEGLELIDKLVSSLNFSAKQ